MIGFENKKINLILGSIVCIVFIFFIVWFNQRASVSHVSNQEKILYAKFTNIGTIDVGSNVTIGGINIGKVTNMKFLPKQKVILVEMSMRDINIPADSMAEVATYGLFGSNYILVVPGSMEDNLSNNSYFDFVQNAVSFDLVIRELGGKLKQENMKKT